METEDVVVTGKPRHIGRIIRRIREMKGMPQYLLASEIGITPQAMCEIEGKDHIRKSTLTKVAKGLKIEPEYIENFDEEAVMSNIFNNCQISGSAGGGFASGSVINHASPETIGLLLQEIRNLNEQLNKKEKGI